METIEAIHTRRSIRAYLPEPVPRELIQDLLWDAVQAPSPPISGEIPWALCVIEGKERLAEYGCDVAQGYLIGRPVPLEALLNKS